MLHVYLRLLTLSGWSKAHACVRASGEIIKCAAPSAASANGIGSGITGLPLRAIFFRILLTEHLHQYSPDQLSKPLSAFVESCAKHFCQHTSTIIARPIPSQPIIRFESSALLQPGEIASLPSPPPPTQDQSRLLLSYYTSLISSPHHVLLPLPSTPPTTSGTPADHEARHHHADSLRHSFGLDCRAWDLVSLALKRQVVVFPARVLPCDSPSYGPSFYDS